MKMCFPDNTIWVNGEIPRKIASVKWMMSRYVSKFVPGDVLAALEITKFGIFRLTEIVGNGFYLL